MVALRQAGYCNLKLFLLYLVIYGHWIEPRIGSDIFLSAQYQLIYLIHMPLFAFLSGLFLKDSRSCARQIRKLFPIYAAAQGICILLGSGTVSVLTPFWHLWYLLSCCFWSGLAWLWFRFGSGRGKLLILAVSFAAGLAVSYVPWIGRTLSASRTIVFFPFFWAGIICPSDISWRKFRKFGLTALVLAILCFQMWGSRMSTGFLYHADPYSVTGGNAELRLQSYLLSTMFGFFLLTIIPPLRLPFTRAGADTLPSYLLHAPLVAVLREIALPWPCYAIGSAWVLYLLYIIPRWGRPLYGIAPGERRNWKWPVFRKFTNNSPGPSTGSSSP